MKYTTKDLFLAVFLMTTGYEVSLKRESDSRFTFEFNQDEKLEEIVSDFYEGRAVVEPLGFCSSMRQLKSRMYNSN